MNKEWRTREPCVDRGGDFRGYKNSNYNGRKNNILKEISEEKKKEELNLKKIRAIKEKAYSVSNTREKNKDAYKPWTSELDEELTKIFNNGINVKDLSKHFGRSRGAIQKRLIKLDLDVPW